MKNILRKETNNWFQLSPLNRLIILINKKNTALETNLIAESKFFDSKTNHVQNGGHTVIATFMVLIDLSTMMINISNSPNLYKTSISFQKISNHGCRTPAFPQS